MRDTNVKKGFEMELTREDGEYFVQPGFGVNSAICVHADNPDYDEKATREAEEARELKRKREMDLEDLDEMSSGEVSHPSDDGWRPGMDSYNDWVEEQREQARMEQQR